MCGKCWKYFSTKYDITEINSEQTIKLAEEIHMEIIKYFSFASSTSDFE